MSKKRKKLKDNKFLMILIKILFILLIAAFVIGPLVALYFAIYK